ncbi:type II CRISPR RNA-guided endonuclease Cas9 [Leuconostocaceae bacterium ESL0958]|nr:type II CRISPR RNA-guided endonuclease Cas9 [Leuconostocaceae bacterium ESL0958]
MVYDVGLDIGTGSVGWAVLDEAGKLKRAKGKNLIGVRLFDSAQTAAERRVQRTTRRRLSRRKWRLRLLDELFAPDIQEFDPAFFNRLKYAYVHPQDEQNRAHYYGGHLFPTQEETAAFHKKYPTIYHLRNALMVEQQKKFDLRAIYLAIHHIVKYRGHFLNNQAKINIGTSYDATTLAAAIASYAERKELSWDLAAPEELANILSGEAGYGLSKLAKAEAGLACFTFDSKQDKNAIKAILTGLAGNEIDFKSVFNRQIADKETAQDWKLKFSDENFDEKSQVVLADLDDDEIELLNALQQAYDGFLLISLLNGESSVSAAKVKSYQQHREDRQLLKKLATAAHWSHRDFSELYAQLLAVNDETTLNKAIKRASELVQSSDLAAAQKEEALLRLKNQQFLPRQRVKDNAVIPYQLHLAELSLILANQGQFYPFLLDTFDKEGQVTNKIEELVRFRIPYYVGPLVTKADVKQAGGNAENHWVTRQPGYEKSRVTPWNFHQVFNRDQAARDFIDRLTGTDTYLIGEPTLPQYSLRYQLFTVLNELNNLRINGEKIDQPTKERLINDLFKQKKTVTLKALKKYYQAEGRDDITVTGLADETKFNSSLSSYINLAKVFGVGYMEDPAHLDLLEKIIEIQTVFEDSLIATRELEKLPISDEQVKKLAQIHYTGWGNLSKKLLTTAIIEERGHKVSILDKLRTTSKNFMSIISKEEYHVQDWIQDQNTIESNQSFDDRVNELTTSPANKRGIKQAFAVLKDLQSALKEEPRRIYLEFAREDQNSVRTRSRYAQMKQKYQQAGLSGAAKTLKDSLKDHQDLLHDDRYYLYFQQEGKDMYTGQAINLERLSADYDIDHIIPQAFIKDDSLDNRVLVARPENARKSNSASYTAEVANQAGPLWHKLYRTGLINRKKFERLQTSKSLDRQKKGFIARQLVETRQIIKNVATLIDSEFEASKAVAIRSEITADMRQLVAIKKHREINHYHHAFDALLITAAGQYMQARYPDRDGANVYEEFDRYMNAYIQNLRQNTDGQSVRRLKSFGFVVGTMRKGNENWSEANTDYLRRVMHYKNILTTKKTKINNGALSKETILAVDPKKKLIAMNQQRENVALYGGYTYAYPAYMTLVRAKGKNQLVKVTVQAAHLIESGQLSLADYVQSLPEVKKFEKVLLARLPLGQLVVDDGQLIYLASNEYRHNAKQLWLSAADADLVASISEQSTAEQCQRAFDILTSSAVQKRLPFFAQDLQKLVQLRDDFADVADQAKVIQTILRGLQLDAAYQKPVHLISKKVAEWHSLQQSGGIKLSDDAEIIYQSPTGIFEKRVKIADLR